MENKILILRDDVWYEIELYNNKEIRYNSIVNKIGETKNRQISFSNTFEVPFIEKNIKSLGVNNFNPYVNARSFNSKYVAKYFINNILIRTGFIVINNVKNKTIKLNFIDFSLGILDFWGKNTHKQIVNKNDILKPSDFNTAISEMSNFQMLTNSQLGSTSNIGSRGYKLALFPNSLNCIGDDFQINSNGQRLQDTFIPYQSRPAISLRATLDLACESFGYTPIYDSSIDLERLNKTYYISKNVNDSKDSENIFQEKTYSTESVSDAYNAQSGFYRRVMQFNVTKSLRPENVSNFNLNGDGDILDRSSFADYYIEENWEEYESIFIPDLSSGNSGTLEFSFSWENSSQYTARPLAVWNNISSGGSVVFQDLTNIRLDIQSNSRNYSFKIDKTFINVPPNNASNLIGIMVIATGGRTGGFQSRTKLINQSVVESTLINSDLAFGELSEYIQNNVDLTHAFSNESMKKIVSSIMHFNGYLMNIDSIKKEVKFFTYGSYKISITNNEYRDWSKYLLRDANIEKDTNFGKKYAQLNIVSLDEPFNENSFGYILNNNNGLSKYKSLNEDKVELYKDIVKVKSTPNLNTSYSEYSVSDESLVENIGTLGVMDESNISGNINGQISNLPHLANVNYNIPPQGVLEWYNIVNNSIRVKAMFLLPLIELKNIDLSIPVYINDLGGYYIIEEISEYVNSKTPVKIKLLKVV